MVSWDNICGLRQSHWASTVPTPQISSYLMCQKFHTREIRLTFFIKDNINEKIMKAGLLAWGLYAEVGRKTEVTFVLRITWRMPISHLRKAMLVMNLPSPPSLWCFHSLIPRAWVGLEIFSFSYASNSGQNNSSLPIKWIVKKQRTEIWIPDMPKNISGCVYHCLNTGLEQPIKQKLHFLICCSVRCQKPFFFLKWINLKNDKIFVMHSIAKLSWVEVIFPSALVEVSINVLDLFIRYVIMVNICLARCISFSSLSW